MDYHPAAPDDSSDGSSASSASSVVDDRIVTSESVHVVTIPSAAKRRFPSPPPRAGDWLDSQGQTIPELLDWERTSASRRRELWTAYVIEEGKVRADTNATPLVRTRIVNKTK
jgi:hypothetical protein